MTRRRVVPLALVLTLIAAVWPLHASEPFGPWQSVFPTVTRAPLRALAYHDGRFVAVGKGIALSSEDGVVWTESATWPDVTWEALIWAGDRFVAVGWSSTGFGSPSPGWVATSRDGVVWDAVELPVDYHLHDVAWDGAAFTAVGSERGAPLLLRSVDGVAWTALEVPASRELVAVLACELGWFASGPSTTLHSGDGLAWEVVSSESLTDLLWDGSRIVATCADPQGYEHGVVTSSDGLDWSWQSYPRFGYWVPSRLAWNGSQLLLAGGADVIYGAYSGGVTTSGDGVEWTELVTTPYCLDAVLWAEGLWVAVGYQGIIGTSVDGASWRWSSPGGWLELNDLAANGSEVVAVGGALTPYVQVGMCQVTGDLVEWRQSETTRFPFMEATWTGNRWLAWRDFGSALEASVDGVSWAAFGAPPGMSPIAMTASPDTIVLIGDAVQERSIATADASATQWQTVPVPDGGLPADVAWTGEAFVVVGAWMTGWSLDGRSWEIASNDEVLTEVVAGDGRLVAVGRAGAVAWSSDGRAWSRGDSGLAADLVALTWAGDRWVAGTLDGTLIESPDGAAWAPAEPFPWPPLRDLAWSGRELIGLGDRDRMARRRAVDALLPASAPRLVVPVAARRPGAAGTVWRSDLSVLGPLDAHAELYLGLAADAGATPPQWRRFILPPGAQLDLDDVVQRSFALDDGAGALLVASEQAVTALSRSFTVGEAGTHGELFPALAARELVPPGGVAVLPMLEHDELFRTNLGFTNPGDEALALEIELVDASGRRLGSRELELPALGWVQLDGILAELAVDPVADAYALVTNRDATQPLAAYASVVDNRSGDPTLVLPVQPSADAVVVPAVAHGPGVAGTFWTSEVAVVNPGPGASTYRLELLAGEVVASAPFTLAPGEARRYRDVVASVFARDGAAALRVVPSTGAVAVVSRTATSGAGGSFGQGVPAVVPGPRSAASEAVLPGLAESAAARTNLGLVNPSERTVTARVSLYRGDGSAVASFRREVAAHSLVILNGVFARAGVSELESGYAVVRCEDPGGALLAWASVVDNASGDPSFVSPR